LLPSGEVVFGEVPACARDSAAARGRLSTACSEELVQRALGLVRPVPHPRSPLLDVACATSWGEECYVWPARSGRFFRGARAALTPELAAGVGRPGGKQRAWRCLSARPAGGAALPAGAPPLALVCGETEDYHRAVRAEVGPGDVVLEIGCDFGAACAIAAQACGAEGSVVGIDLAPTSVHAASALHPAILFRVVDVLQASADLSALRALVGGRAFSKVLIDVNGNRDLGAVCRVLEVAATQLAPPALIVKSRQLLEAVEGRASGVGGC
jgi:hypothetical protein